MNFLRPANGISLGEYQARRRQLMNAMEPGSIALIPGASMQRRNRDIDYAFRQDSDLLYLCGFEEPDALLVLVPGRSQGEVILFCRERDPRAEQWDGGICGPERAVGGFAVDDAFPITDVDDILPGLLEGRRRIYQTMGEYPAFDQKLLSYVATIRGREAGGAIPPGEFVSLKHLLHEQRLIKSDAEIQLMQKAADISAGAHIRAMQCCTAQLTEGQLEAELLYEFMRNGARHSAYPSIIGSGNNGCVLHYTNNDAPLQDGNLVLIDAGCEYQHYAADITRTFPVSGLFSPPQRALYNIVLAANEAAIAQCRPGTPFNAPHEAAVAVMVEGLIRLGLLQGTVADNVEAETYLQYCPHKSCHWLGLDVHDVGDYRLAEQWRPLQPGMVLTVEPGIYVAQDSPKSEVIEPYLGNGIRIEDDVLITDNGCQVLSRGVPKAAAEIEALMRVA
ncbi:MAG: aminopeptidase P N-terminal domain-containing protein [Pseudomonadota bacterium]|nr:aminopeptidase P N-terminal domain-containing protein [Pseudomonadota bacterium]MEC7779770.1 aminopeptidase P N-terminal domain-containing protein [Pseudomonadota bacterium]MEC8070587.1 aminopeptidase P N-terminal domain-containing protein [Pseudomonadota bacterium]MED5347601.1 aminopeptidase P N-terminal domain-containing protein [Pseudomonadota bacterium]